MPSSFVHQVVLSVKPQRLQEYGVGVFDVIATKSALKKALKKNQITVNGTVATTATMISGGETIVYKPPETVVLQKKLMLKLKVLYEDDHLAAVYKPAGLLVSGNSFKTLARALPQNLKRSRQPDAVKPQPVHRLDYATTGILLVGKTAESIRRLNRLFEHKEVEKIYYAVTIGQMPSAGILTEPIDGKEAISNYKTVQRVVSARFEQLNLVKLKPETGRRHQLRIHLAGAGNPILGDREYSPEHQLLKGKGMYLHAQALAFIHPFAKKPLRLTAGLPARFSKIFSDRIV